MSDDYTYLSTRAWAGIDGFDDKDLNMFRKFCEFLDATGEEWSLDQIKTKFSYDDLRFYVSGSEHVQKLASALEQFWHNVNKPEDDDE